MDENQKQHQKKKIILRIIGIVLLIAGITCAIIGFIDMPKSFEEGRLPKMWCFFIGFPSIVVGGFILLVSFQRSINRYIKNENVPVINEYGKEISPALSSMANAMHTGINESPCPACGTLNDKDARFCKSCGKELMLECSECGTINEADAKFCKKCGRPF